MTKKGQSSLVKGRNYEFLLPYYLKCRVFRMLHLPKRHVVLKVLAENKMFYFSKRALRVSTASNKWLK